MRIMVFDVSAESGGALTVLHDFYDEYKKNLDNEYIFVVSKPEIPETKNICVLRFPWIKKSWFHRLYFDYFIASRLIIKYKVDEVLSLQNIMIPRVKVPQSVFVHNALPFADYRFSIFDDRLLWVYQNVLSRAIFRSIKKADRVIVQTNWMKEQCINQLNVNDKNVVIVPPVVKIDVQKTFIETKKSLTTFFYPASGVIFKNHKLIIDTCLKLKEEGINEYKFIFTLKGNENKNISKLYNEVQDNLLPVEFIGSLTREEVFEYYSKSILIFPSLIETVGLPLIEARVHNAPIIALSNETNREILDGYKNVAFFLNNSTDLAQLINRHIKKWCKSG